jgi:dolichol kinase
VDWSTSYQAGSSRCAFSPLSRRLLVRLLLFSSASRSTTEDDDTEDDLPRDFRGRAFSQNGLRNGPNGNLKVSLPTLRRPSPHPNSSGDSTGASPGHNNRVPFTRSRSPAVIMNSNTTRSQRTMSPSMSFFSFRKPGVHGHVTLLPSVFQVHTHFPLSPWTWTLRIDARKLGECLLLLASLLYASSKLMDPREALSGDLFRSQRDVWISLGSPDLICPATIHLQWHFSRTLFPQRCCSFI